MSEHESRVAAAALEEVQRLDRMAGLGRLTTALAHDLGTPLNVILGRAQMIASGDVEADEVAASARIVAEQARVMTRLLRQTVEYARTPETGAAPIDLLALCARTAALLQPVARKRQVALAVAPDAEPVLATAEPVVLGQALLDLVLDALDRADPEGGRVTLTCGRAPDGAWLELQDATDAPAPTPDALPGGRPAATASVPLLVATALLRARGVPWTLVPLPGGGLATRLHLATAA